MKERTDLFLLMASLSGIDNMDQVQRIFTEAMNHAFPDCDFTISDEKSGSKEAISLQGKNYSFGELSYDRTAELSAEDHSTIRNAAALLTIILEQKALSRELSDKNVELTEEVEENRIFIDKVTQTVPVLIYIYSLQTGKNQYANQSIMEMLSYTPEEIRELGSGFMARIAHPEDIYNIVTHHSVLSGMNMGENRDLEYRIKDAYGNWHWLQSRDTPFRKDEDGRTTEILGCAWDITDQRRKDRLIKATFEQAAVGVAVGDLNGKLIQFNQKFSQILGYSGEELSGRNIMELQLPAEMQGEQDQLNKLIMNKKNKLMKDRRFNRKSGSQIWCRMTLSVMSNKSGDPENIIIILEDITDRMNDRKHLAALNETLEIQYKELLKAKNRAEENDRLKTAFIQNMSHEIRTPLNGIMGFTEILAKQTLTDEERLHFSDIVLNNSQQLLNIVNDIMDISRLEAGELLLKCEEVNVQELLRELGEEYSKAAKVKNLQFVLSADEIPENAILETDILRLRQILSNILNNALKFTKEGYVSLSAYIKGNEITFKITDTGSGIPEIYQKKIFERFRQIQTVEYSQPDGNGLGLTISQKLAGLLGGVISVESDGNKGSAFFLELPLRNGTHNLFKPLYRTGEETKENDMQKPVILIVEDDVTNSQYINWTLQKKGYKTYTAYSGPEAIKLCETQDDIQLVLMDIKMPGMSGVEAFNRIKAIRPELPVIAQTAYAMTGDREKYLGAGFNGYISKPIDSRKLEELILST